MSMAQAAMAKVGAETVETVAVQGVGAAEEVAAVAVSLALAMEMRAVI